MPSVDPNVSAVYVSVGVLCWARRTVRVDAQRLGDLAGRG